jgi:hypothetical protein
MKSEAMRTSAEFALNESRRSRDVREYIRHEPVTALAMAAGAGFIVRGEASARPGLALRAFIGQIAVREAATYFVIGTVADSDRARRDLQNRSRIRRSAA